MMAGIAMIVVGMTSEYYDRDRMLFFGGMFGAFASLSSVCNRLGFVAVVLLHDRARFFYVLRQFCGADIVPFQLRLQP